MRTVRPIHFIVIMVAFPLGEVWRFFKGYREIDPFLFVSFPMDWQWVVKDNCNMVTMAIFVWIAWYFTSGFMKKLLSVCFLYSIGDIVLYWFTFKTEGYVVLYCALSGLFLYHSFSHAIRRLQVRC